MRLFLSERAHLLAHAGERLSIVCPYPSERERSGGVYSSSMELGPSSFVRIEFGPSSTNSAAHSVIRDEKQ
jgi:hypothetical protein